MKKRFTKFLAALALLVFMMPTMAGWGQTKTDQTITLTYASFGLTNSYALKTATVDGYGFTVNQGYKSNNNEIQMNSTKGDGTLYNTTAITGLKSIKVNVGSGNKTYTITTGTSQNPTANSQTGTTGGTYNAASGDTFFQLKVSGASYFSSIVITYETGGGGGGDTPTVTDISGITAAGNYSVTGTVVAKSMYGMVIGDGTGYVFYSNGSSMPSYNIGANITIEGPVTVSGSSDPKLFQFTNSTATITNAESSSYNPNDAEPIALSELTTTQTTGTHLSDYYTFEGTLIKPGSYYIVEIGNYSQIQLYGPTSASPVTTTALNNLLNKKVTVTGYFNGKPSSGLWAVMPETVVENTAPDTYEWVPVSLSSLTTSDVFVIVGTTGDNKYAMANDKGASNAPTAVSVTIEDGKISSYVPHNLKWNVSGTTDSYTFYPVGQTDKWLYCTTANDGVRVGTNNNKTFKISSGYLYNNATSSYLSYYSNQWRRYTNTNNNPLTASFYKRQLITSDPTLTISTNNINDFNQTVSGGPTVKSFTVGGRNLGTTPITIALGASSSDFELSFDENAATWQNSITTADPTDGEVANTTVYVRMKANLVEGSHSGSISVTSGSLSETISLSGTVNPDPVTYTYTAATSITPGKRYIIVGFADDSWEQPYAMAEQKSSNRGAISIASYYDSDEDEFSVPSDAGVYEFVISGDGTNKYSVYDTENNGYLYATKGSNALNQQSTLVNAGKWSIAKDGNNDNMVIAVTINKETRIMKFNYSNNNQLFSCYTSGQKDIYLYEKDSNEPLEFYSSTSIASPTLSTTNTMTVESGAVVTFTGTPSCIDASWLVVKDGGQLKFYATGTKDGEVQATLEKNIEKYTADNNGWNFIASPINVSDLAATDVTNMLSNTYDLYQLNNTKWENYKTGDGNAHPGFSLANGRGYLYANSADVTLSFAGAIKPFNNVDHTANQVSVNAGWNLIGNPYTFDVYLNQTYYSISQAQAGITANIVASNATAIKPCTGVLVYANSNGNGYVEFSENAPDVSTGNHGNIQMTLAHNVATRDGYRTETIDNAIVSFNDDSYLEKFYFGEPEANIFIPQNGRDYAITFSNRLGDVPLNFKTNKISTYTISFEGEEMDLNGVYLIDMLEEEEIDLSTTTSYTFLGSPSDKAARFKIVFRNTGDNADSDIFAYQNGSDIVVCGEGELQIFDVMGRIVAKQYVNGVGTWHAASVQNGVYILKLNEKTQKIVVR